MCTGGGKAPELKPAPQASPRPTVEAPEASPATQEDTRKKRIQQYRSGFASTLKTGPQGIDTENKTTLGS